MKLGGLLFDTLAISFTPLSSRTQGMVLVLEGPLILLFVFRVPAAFFSLCRFASYVWLTREHS